MDLVLSESFSSFFVNLFPWGYLKSISRVLKDDYSNVFTFVLMAFLTASSQESSSRPWASNWAQREGLRPSWKYRIIVFLLGIAIELNSQKTACKCSRGAA